MKVRATKRGYYQRIREPGEEFEYPIKPDDPMPSWMVRVATKADQQPEEDEEDEELLD